MKLQGENIVMDKEEFLTNSLFTGIACQLLAQMTNRELSDWMEYLSDKASEQYKQMTPKQREDMINSYVQISEQLWIVMKILCRLKLQYTPIRLGIFILSGTLVIIAKH